MPVPNFINLEPVFNHPRLLGFNVPNFPGTQSCGLTIHMFPLTDNSLNRDLHIQNMPGITLTTSIGSPPVNNEWSFNKYFIMPIFNITTTLYNFLKKRVRQDGEDDGGLCIMLDITEGTTLAANRAGIHTPSSILEKIYNIDPPSFSYLEDADVKITIKQIVLTAVANLRRDYIAQFGNEEQATIAINRLPFWKLFSLLTYYILLLRVDQNGAPVNNCRVFLVKRTLGERFNSPEFPTAWLAMSQYYRIMFLFQTQFVQSSNIVGEPAVQMKPLRKMIFRDAHSCTTTSFSAEYDINFFQGTSAQLPVRKPACMVGVSPDYKYYRHAQLYSQDIQTWLEYGPKESRTGGRYSFGVLAGVCWFYNPNNLAGNALFSGNRVDSILKLPFGPMENWPNGRGGVFKGFPAIPEKDHRNLINSFIGAGSIFAYGIDEYILSELVALQMRDADLWNRVPILFYQIQWFCKLIRPDPANVALPNKDSKKEFNPVLLKLLRALVSLERPRRNIITSDYIALLLERNDLNLANLFFNTFFGNTDNVAYNIDNVILPLMDPLPSVEWIQNYISEKVALLKSYCRYDRLFWIPAVKNPRIRADGTQIIPCNIQDPRARYEGIKFAIANPVQNMCAYNNCGVGDIDYLKQLTAPYGMYITPVGNNGIVCAPKRYAIINTFYNVGTEIQAQPINGNVMYNNQLFNRVNPPAEGRFLRQALEGLSGRKVYVYENVVYKSVDTGPLNLHGLLQEVSRNLITISKRINHTLCYGIKYIDDSALPPEQLHRKTGWYMIEHTLHMPNYCPPAPIPPIINQANFDAFVNQLRLKEIGGDFKFDNLGIYNDQWPVATDLILPSSDDPFQPMSYDEWWRTVAIPYAGNNEERARNIFLDFNGRLNFKCNPPAPQRGGHKRLKTRRRGGRRLQKRKQTRRRRVRSYHRHFLLRR